MPSQAIDRAKHIAGGPSLAGVQPADEALNGVTSPSLPMYLAALIVTACGLFAATEYLADDGFTFLVFGLTVLGFIVSLVSRQQNVSPRNIELPALIICGCVFLSGLISDQPFLAPASIGDDRHRSLAVLLIWLTVFRSFTLINDGALLFCCVPTIALIGLISTNMTDTSLLSTFVVFVAAASFLMVHENYLRTRASTAHRQSRRSGSSMIGSQIQVAAVCVAASVFLANVLVVPLRSFLNQVQMSAGIPTINRNNPNTTTVSPLNIVENQDVRIGMGPVSQSDQIVMRVQTDLAEPYWRGSTFDKYTGHGWKNQLEAKQIYPIAVPNRVDGGMVREDDPGRANTFEMPATTNSTVQGKRHTAVQRVQLQAATFEAVYAAAEPRTLKMSYSQATADDTGSIHLNDSTINMQYEVKSEVSDAGPSELRHSSGAPPSEIADLYLQVPDDRAMVARWTQAATAATAGISTQYDKVEALSRWIGGENNCKYNLKADAVPATEDVVDTFLFKQKQGYCDSFASSLAMLCRSIGIPARVASGFLTGEMDRVKREFVVRERDKHQWTEVYFNGVGWVKFDPTSFAENITPEDETRGAKAKSFLAFLFGRGWLPPLALAAFVAMLVYVVKVEVWDRLRGGRRLTSGLDLPATNQDVVAQYDLACEALANRGLRKSSWETAAEYRDRIHHALGAWAVAQEHFDRLTAILITARYSGQASLPDDVLLAREAVAGLKSGLRAVRRRDLEAAIAAPAVPGSAA